MNQQETHVQFALCLDNAGYEASLELGKLYKVVDDEQSGIPGYIRVVDESGEDYVYEADRFYLITLPEPVEQTLLLAMV